MERPWPSISILQDQVIFGSMTAEVDNVGTILEEVVEQLVAAQLPPVLQQDVLGVATLTERGIDFMELGIQVERLRLLWIGSQKENSDLFIVHGNLS